MKRLLKSIQKQRRNSPLSHPPTHDRRDTTLTTTTTTNHHHHPPQQQQQLDPSDIDNDDDIYHTNDDHQQYHHSTTTPAVTHASLSSSSPAPPESIAAELERYYQPQPSPPVTTTTFNHHSTTSTDETRDLVKQFLADIWNRGALDMIPVLCSPSLRFNGNTGACVSCVWLYCVVLVGWCHSCRVIAFSHRLLLWCTFVSLSRSRSLSTPLRQALIASVTTAWRAWSSRSGGPSRTIIVKSIVW